MKKRHVAAATSALVAVLGLLAWVQPAAARARNHGGTTTSSRSTVGKSETMIFEGTLGSEGSVWKEADCRGLGYVQRKPGTEANVFDAPYFDRSNDPGYGGYVYKITVAHSVENTFGSRLGTVARFEISGRGKYGITFWCTDNRSDAWVVLPWEPGRQVIKVPRKNQ
jgi:hypothetical protein